MTNAVLFWVVALGALVEKSLLMPTPPSDPEDISETPSPEEGPFLEGDIVIDSEIIPVSELRQHLQRNLVSDPRRLWPGKEVPYQFAPGQFSASLKAAVEDALSDLMDHSCVRFTPWQGHTTYLKLRVTGKRCTSKVGYREDSPSSVQLGSVTCQSRGTVQHEFLHALGFWHEHTRPDRDNFVTVLWDNVRPDRKKDFIKRSDSEVTIQGLPYDYASVMHYKHTAFSKPRGAVTLEPKNKEAVHVMGQRRGVSRVDIAKLNRLYNCTGDKYYKGHDLEGMKTVFGEVLEKGKNGEGRKIIDEDVQTICKDDERKGCDERPNNNEKHSIEKMISFLRPEVLKAHDFNEEHIYSNLEQPVQMRVKKVLVEKVIDSQTIKSSEISIIINKTNEIKTILDTVLENSPRMKRQASDMMPRESKDVEMGEQKPTDGKQESFTPQKILPELLKGVLGNDKDRPIVIQFAIYQPIVYKSSNESESSDKDAKQSTEKPMKEQVTDKMVLKEPIIKDADEEGVGQIRSLRDRENLYREKIMTESHDDEEINFRTGSYNEPQRKRTDDIKMSHKDSTLRNFEPVDEFSQRPKKEYSPLPRDELLSTKDFIQPLKVSEDHDDHSSITAKYEERRRDSEFNDRRYNNQREDYNSHPYRHDGRDEHFVNSDERTFGAEHNSKVGDDHISPNEDGHNFRHTSTESYYDTRHFENDKQNQDFRTRDNENYEKGNRNKDTQGQSRSDFDSHGEQSPQFIVNDGHTLIENNNEPSSQNHRSDEDINRSAQGNNQSPSRFHEEERFEKVRPDIEDTNSESWNRRREDERLERTKSSIQDHKGVEDIRDYSDNTNARKPNDEGLKDVVIKRQNPRPDLFIEENLNDDLDKEIRRRKIEKELAKDMKRSTPDRMPQESNQNPVVSRDKIEDVKQPRDKFGHSEEQQSKKDHSSKEEEEEGKQDFVTDNEGLAYKPHSMLNLNPRQALPLNAPSKSSTKRLVRVEKVQGVKRSIKEK